MRFDPLSTKMCVYLMENPKVFRETHKLIFKLIKERKVTGLRVDHVDGLYNPVEYLYRLQKGCFI